MKDADLLAQFRHYLLSEDQSPATIRAYLSDLSVFQRWLSWLYEGKDISLVQVQAVELSAFRKHLIHEKQQSPATVNRRVQSLRTFYAFLARQKMIEINPAGRLRFVRGMKRRRPDALNRAEVLALLREAGKSSHGMGLRNTAILQLMLQTGLRIGETAVLKFGDIVLKERSGKVIVREGKGRKAREVPLNSAARRALNQYLDTLSEVEKEPGVALFKSKKGNSLTIRGLQKMIAKLVREAGLEDRKISAHTLRHTFAINYLKSNQGKLVELAALMGHDSLDTTALYTQASSEDLSADLERSALNTFEI